MINYQGLPSLSTGILLCCSVLFSASVSASVYVGASYGDTRITDSASGATHRDNASRIYAGRKRKNTGGNIRGDHLQFQLGLVQYTADNGTELTSLTPRYNYLTVSNRILDVYLSIAASYWQINYSGSGQSHSHFFPTGGAGFNFHLTKSISLNLEYSIYNRIGKAITGNSGDNLEIIWTGINIGF